jgi:hypothetical protein
MQIVEIVQIMENRLLTLVQIRDQAVSTGDLQRVMEIDMNIETTKNSIAQLKTLN